VPARTTLAVAVVALTCAAAASSAPTRPFVVRSLVTNAGDRQLVNPWGLAAWRGGPWWVANEARNSSTLYTGAGRKQVGSITVEGGPTGVAFYGGRGFLVHGEGGAAPARFLYACEDGTIRAWTPSIPRGWSTTATTVVDTGASGTVFRGIAVTNERLYVTDFHNARVLVFDARWRRVKPVRGFVDERIPAWYAPFGIAAFGGKIFVTYAGRAPVNGNDAPTGGYVDEFDRDGRLVARIGDKSQFDEPWGLALAPVGFGRLGKHLLVANFGSGRINVYRPHGRRWSFRGRLPVSLPGVWGIAFGSGGMNGPRTSLFYAAGPHDWHGASEVHVGGDFGVVRTLP
jgi:uncharacterized protein (TIGR03118 family)